MLKWEEQTTVVFAGKATSFPPNTLKINFKVQGWPFKSLQNSMAMIMDAHYNVPTTHTEAPKTCYKASTDDSGNLKWFLMNVDDTEMYVLDL